MIKTFAFRLFLVVMAQQLFAEHIPEKGAFATKAEAIQRLFVKKGAISGMLEIKGRLEQENRGYRSVTIGPYYRLSRHWRIGGFYRVQQGQIHDDDWIALNPGWEWKKTTSRTEHVFSADISPKTLLPFLNFGKFEAVGESKFRYEYNT
ncbi:MAG: hypothetical protein D6767_07295, partial [Candidatus Hydrogenedentota bacterium]